MIGDVGKFDEIVKFCDEFLLYKDGKLFWRKHWRRTELAGCEAGAKGRVTILGNVESVRNIIFLIHYGFYSDYIVRVDGDRNNNSIENLVDNESLCKKPNVVNQHYVRKILKYDGLTGNFIWRYTNPLVSSIRKGNVAGTTDSLGYKRIKIFGKVYFYHKLIWMYLHGDEPMLNDIDHIDRNPSNNKLANLRLVTRKLNCRNRETGKNPISGHRGVRCGGNGKYGAFIGDKWLGTFDSIEEAIEVRKEQEQVMGYII